MVGGGPSHLARAAPDSLFRLRRRRAPHEAPSVGGRGAVRHVDSRVLPVGPPGEAPRLVALPPARAGRTLCSVPYSDRHGEWDLRAAGSPGRRCARCVASVRAILRAAADRDRAEDRVRVVAGGRGTETGRPNATCHARTRCRIVGYDRLSPTVAGRGRSWQIGFGNLPRRNPLPCMYIYIL